MPGIRSRIGQRIDRRTPRSLGRVCVARVVCILGLLPAAFGSRTPQAPQLEALAVSATEGHAQLGWESSHAVESGAGPWSYELQESTSPEFDEPIRRYSGPQRRTFVSGLPAGTHHYRVRQRTGEGEWSPWSEPVSVEIRPYSLAFAWSLFIVGGILVTAIVVFICVADRRVRSEEGAL